MTLDRLAPIARELGTTELLDGLREEALKLGCDARWLRSQYNRCRELSVVVEAAVATWRDDKPASGMAEPMPALRRRVRASSEPIPSLEGFNAAAFTRSRWPLH